MTLLNRVKELVSNRGMSLAELERTLGFGQGSIRKWDQSNPSTDKLTAVADYFHVSTDFLLGREGAETQQETEFRKALENVMSFDGEKMTESDKDAIISFMMGRKGK